MGCFPFFMLVFQKDQSLAKFSTWFWCSCGAVGKDYMEKVNIVDVLTTIFGGSMDETSRI